MLIMSYPIPQSDWSVRWALYQPDKIAVEEADSQRTLTYGALNAAGDEIATQFQQRGFVKGDRIVVLSDFTIELVSLFTAGQKHGFTMVPVNYRLSPAEISYLVDNADPVLILTTAHYQHLLEAVSPTYQSKIQSFDFLEEILTRVQNGYRPAAFDAVALQDDDAAFILFTSGTTGFPKGALYTHGMLFWNSINTAISLILNNESRTINFMPPFHTGGWNVLLTPFLHHGAYICLTKKFEPVKVLELLQSKDITIFMGVPTMLRMMAETDTFADARFPNLLYVIVGGEAMPIPLIETWDAKGVPVRQGYGLTEVGPNITSLHQRDAIRKKGSIGRANFYVQTYIAKEDGSRALPGEQGELWLKGPMTMPGYWNNPEASKHAFKDGWFCTGDVVIEDEEGYLFVVDRLKNMFISGGENVYPAEIERHLAAYPGVAEVVVIGVPDPKWGEVGLAFIRFNGDPPAQEEIIAWCRERIAKFKIPKHFRFVGEIPKNDAGKINRLALKKLV
jgi:fatty-acyl-CoA synthase